MRWKYAFATSTLLILVEEFAVIGCLRWSTTVYCAAPNLPGQSEHKRSAVRFTISIPDRHINCQYRMLEERTSSRMLAIIHLDSGTSDEVAGRRDEVKQSAIELECLSHPSPRKVPCELADPLDHLVHHLGVGGARSK